MCEKTPGCPKNKEHGICWIPVHITHCPVCEKGKDSYTWAGSVCIRCEFFLAAKEYAKLMTSDFRNTYKAEEVQKRMDTARGKFYDLYRRMEDSQ